MNVRAGTLTVAAVVLVGGPSAPAHANESGVSAEAVDTYCDVLNTESSRDALLAKLPADAAGSPREVAIRHSDFDDARPFVAFGSLDVVLATPAGLAAAFSVELAARVATA